MINKVLTFTCNLKGQKKCILGTVLKNNLEVENLKKTKQKKKGINNAI